jgi:hypothetical protein
MMMVQQAALWFGVVLLIVGVLGFVPGITVDNYLLGIFHVNAIHNIIHLVSGALLVWASKSGEALSQRVFQVFGVVYALVALLGFVYGDDYVLGLVSNNMADSILHLVIAAGALYLGFSNKTETSVSPPSVSNTPGASTPL